MRQGKTLQELGRELQRQRLNRQDFLADTRSLEVETNSYGSTLHLSLEGKTYGFGIGDCPSANRRPPQHSLSLLPENAE